MTYEEELRDIVKYAGSFTMDYTLLSYHSMDMPNSFPINKDENNIYYVLPVKLFKSLSELICYYDTAPSGRWYWMYDGSRIDYEELKSKVWTM